MNNENSIEADVGMIFEGSYPYVSGGVSSWAQQLIESLPELTFSIIVLLPDETPREPKYKIPRNVVQMHHIYIHDVKPRPKLYPFRTWKWVETIEKFHRGKKKFNIELFKSVLELFRGANAPKLEHLLNSQAAFDLVKRIYTANAAGESFLDYFWTWRFLHLGLFKILQSPLHSCRIYHAVSTGYCGVYGAMLKHFFNRPYLLTEHGIYTRERKIEINLSEWIYDKRREEIRPDRTLGTFKLIWAKAFSKMSHITYNFADEIITLFPGNQKFQKQAGAEEKKMRIIYNGIDFDRYTKHRKQRTAGRFTIAFIGRVVPIKDVKTFLRCMKIISYEIPEMNALIMGPTDENPKYHKECLQLTKLLGLEHLVEYTGKVTVADYFERIDIIMLTSISEAQPLVLLEANAAGIPVVATDVGDCKGLLYGRKGEDRELGQSGFVFGLAAPKEAAEYVYQLHKDLKLYQRISQTGVERVRRYYKKEYQIESYRKLYTSHINKTKQNTRGSG